MQFDDRPRRPWFEREEAPRYTGQRRLYLIIAAVWFVAGLGLLGFAGYQLVDKPGGHETWVYVRPSVPDGVVAAAAQGPGAPLGDQPFRLVIEKLGVDAPVAAYGLDEEAVPQVPQGPDAAEVVAWYQFTALPGSGENAVFGGHVTWDGDAVFKHLGDLQPGDRVVVRGENDGRSLIYRVSETALVDPTSEEAQHWMGTAGADVVTLITCGGDRVEGGEFGHEYTKRQIVRAELIAIETA